MLQLNGQLIQELSEQQKLILLPEEIAEQEKLRKEKEEKKRKKELLDSIAEGDETKILEDIEGGDGQESGKKKKKVKKVRKVRKVKVKKPEEQQQNDGDGDTKSVAETDHTQYTFKTTTDQSEEPENEDDNLDEAEKVLRDLEKKEKAERTLGHQESLKVLKGVDEEIEKGKDKPFPQKLLHEIDPENYVEYFRKYQDHKIPITFQMITNYLNHQEVLKMIVNDKESNQNDKKWDTYHIVLEDDVLVLEQSYKKLKSVLKNLVNYDIIFLGLPSSKPHEEVEKQKSVEFAEPFKYNKVLSGVDSYIISKKCAQQFLDVYRNTVFPTHFQYTYMCRSNKIKILQTIPNIFIEGTKVGIYGSTVLDNNQLIYNPEYNACLMKYNSQFKQDLDEKEKEKIQKEVMEKVDKLVSTYNSPDILFLKGMQVLQTKNYKEAIQIYNQAFELYKEQQAVMSPQSQFLRSFIGIYKEVPI